MAASNDSARLPGSPIGIRYAALGLLLALLVAVLASRWWMRHDLVPDPGAIAERIQPVAYLELAPPPDTATERGKRVGVFLVHQSCRSCHGNGEAGAPRIGDRQAWAPRLNQGLDALVRSVVSGKCGVSRGSLDADDMELARAVVYMIWPRMRL